MYQDRPNTDRTRHTVTADQTRREMRMKWTLSSREYPMIGPVGEKNDSPRGGPEQLFMEGNRIN